VPDRILVVDDEETICDILTAMLRSEGYECETAGSGVEALALLRSGARFDLISSDILMAEMDGPALLGHVKAEFPDIPLVFVCPITDPKVIDWCLQEGALDYQTTLCEREEYVGKIRMALARHRSAI
jgi:CheY-like chemotaxis protein